ncbi:alkaline phosphatase family protein [candidate division KSB1 bacterium]|nr:alkaline phosphatase family protein [candidate division KSB1 bacterium]
MLALPFRLIFGLRRRRKIYSKALVKRVVILGFDGLDPELCQKYLAEGKLPNFAQLKEKGCFKKLATTFPALSPVAWSTFATGVNPGRHSIYDFLMRNRHTYLPELSSAKVGQPKRVLRIGKYSIPLGKPQVKFLRRSKSFWKILGEAGIFSHIVRVPITFPPEKFRGAMLSAMCTPDLRGSQGTFSFYTTGKNGNSKFTGGTRLALTQEGDKLCAALILPDNVINKSAHHFVLLFELTLSPEKREAKLKIARENYTLKEKEFTPWIKVIFRPGLGIKVRGICQFYLKQSSPEVELYVSPINIDPERPALPLSHPYFFSVYLAKLLGSYGTLGMAEDTWSLNEEVLDEDAFLQQAYRIQEEREKQFFHALGKTKKGVCACVFDTTDRIQHMFFRYLVDGHPANNNKDAQEHKNVIPELYQKADELLGRVMDETSDDTLLMVISDHGFKSFVRGINLNSWLHQNGYLNLQNGDYSAEYFQNVDWQNTRVYAIGLAGIYLNIKGREKFGCVEPGEEARKLKKEIMQKLAGMVDSDTKKVAINEVYDSKQIYTGAYVDEAPDLIIGYNDGYRISWDAAIGKTTKTVFQDNTKCWSGDHGIDPKLVPGVIFSNHNIDTENPSLVDIAPTLLQLFGLRVPSYMDGQPLVMPSFAVDSKEGQSKQK